MTPVKPAVWVSSVPVVCTTLAFTSVSLGLIQVTPDWLPSLWHTLLTQNFQIQAILSFHLRESAEFQIPLCSKPHDNHSIGGNIAFLIL